MKTYIFLTSEGSTHQPDSISSEPDIENMQVIGFAYGVNPGEAVKNMIKANDYLTETNFEEIFSLELVGDRRHYFNLKSLGNSQVVE